MDYLPEIIGLRVGSQKFSDAVEQLQAELIRTKKLAENDTLTVTYGPLEELKLANSALEEIKPVYPNECVLVITKTSDKSVLYVKRVIEAEPKGRSVIEKALSDDNSLGVNIFPYVLPRYKGELDLLYYLQITIERFIGQNRMIYSSNFSSMKKASPQDISLSVRHIREKFNELHYDGIYNRNAINVRIKFASKKMEQRYLETTQLLAEVVYIRANPLYDKELETVINEAFSKDREITTVFNNPNHITELGLRMSMLAISAIVDDMKRMRSRDPYLHTERIKAYWEEASAIYELIMNSEYEPENAEMHRYRLDKTTASSFEKMYKEALGDIFKIICVCANIGKFLPGDDIDKFWDKAMAKRETYNNNFMLHNRAFKIIECCKSQEEMSKIIETAGLLNRNLKTGELPELLEKLFYWGRQTTATSAGHVEMFRAASHTYSHYHALVQEQGETMLDSRYKSAQKTGRAIKILLEKMDGLVDSKRKSNAAVNQTLEAFMPRKEMMR